MSYEDGMLYIEFVCEVFEVFKFCCIEIVCGKFVIEVDVVDVKVVN